MDLLTKLLSFLGDVSRKYNWKEEFFCENPTDLHIKYSIESIIPQSIDIYLYKDLRIEISHECGTGIDFDVIIEDNNATIQTIVSIFSNPVRKMDER